MRLLDLHRDRPREFRDRHARLARVERAAGSGTSADDWDPGIGAAHIGHFNTLFFMVLFVAVSGAFISTLRALRYLVRQRASYARPRLPATMPPTS